MNPGTSVRWSNENIRAAIEILRANTSLPLALQQIGEAIGFEVTRDSVDKSFRRSGNGTAYQHLRRGLRLVENDGPNVDPVVTVGAEDVADDWDDVTTEIPKAAVQSMHLPDDTVGGISAADRTYVDRGPERARYHEIELPLSGQLEVALVIPDSHFPFVDRRAWDLVVRVGHHLRQRFSFMRIIQLGDLCDMYSVSTHDKDPRRVTQLSEELASANEGLDELDAIGADSYAMTLGNHEYRLERYLMRNAPMLLDSVSVPELLRLRERGWVHCDYRSHIKLGKLFLTHDTGNSGPYAAAKAGAAFEHSVLIGHTHRLQNTYAGNALGDTHVAQACGWLGDASEIDYLHRVKVMRDWQLGFGMVVVEPSGIVHVQPCPIVDYRTCVLGEIIS